MILVDTCVFRLRTILVIGLVIAMRQCSEQLYRSESAEVGRRVKNYDSRYQQQPAHELGFGYYYQGDIMLPTEPKGQDRLSVAEEYTSTVWPNGIVPYYIAPNTFSLNEIFTIERAMQVFHAKTCVRFVPRRPETPYFVQITNRPTGCYSFIGRSLNNSRNLMNLQTPACLTGGTPMHEMMHVLGFFHEVSRPDRDDYIYVNRSALIPQFQTDTFYESNLAKYDQFVETYNIGYNYGSVMHYSRLAGASDRRYPVLVNRKPYDKPDFGNNTLSPSDIEGIQFRYCRNASGIYRLNWLQQLPTTVLGSRPV
uniref:Metalloendopeptidase n=1 Tax=Anopheles coluzzii TaxID=1518534 RepID=A0A6E8W7P2_ANOCL